ncbi:hypothetical protein [Streptomyces sp. URMC 129]|uniref:hypothetical protein n=1 Tax=Streptomyces sp. URMC 129 TaxID=3423407 RepID=UPI003F1B8637
MGDMTPARRVAIGTTALAAIATTPLFWLLDGPDSAQVAAACLQAATGVAALAYALFHRPSPAAPPPAPAPAAAIEVIGTGNAVATAGGTAVTGLTGPVGSGGARVENTGDAEAHGPGSNATTGRGEAPPR